ncbi:MAG: squalene--hopene cyclase [Pirellulaceae bacterium]|nr:squalene--hopene cyclase [Pirellulaceae bacterium]
MSLPILSAAVSGSETHLYPTRPGKSRRAWTWFASLLLPVLVLGWPAGVRGEGQWEVTGESEETLERGLQWLAANQGAEGNWQSNDLGLVSMGALAFMAAGHSPGRGRYGKHVQRALDYVVDNARPSGLLNISHSQRDMYNHGLATFVLGQAHGMTTTQDRRLNRVLDRALQLIASTQCDDGGWDYRAVRKPAGHDLSLVVMQAKALRSAVDSGLDVPPEVIELAIRSVREHYAPRSGPRDAPEAELRQVAGQFTYGKGGGGGSPAMAAAGVVCLQEFGQYDDWRIPKNMEVLAALIGQLPPARRDGKLPFDAYTLYYVGQALYQVGGDDWRQRYPALRDYLVQSQLHDPRNPAQHGMWRDIGARGGGHVGGKPGELYGTSVACLILAIPNRYLPILQEGRIESLRERFGASAAPPAP